ncbi:chromosome segregation protein SMC [Nitzschia inconspicua]|uniref:Structural maintenance of chromosomes protein n=1 Tax=Nitzschia inconspicua TaxID=303405 RepID=A0A9K3Q0V7_9STRA|nr:chromosome segregation protein SMC [Nitzschia inconspicua]
MHVKQITISNFRSFRQQPEIKPFAATTNCVVGRNGSGKSNLFDAVQFVLLAPRFATLRAEDRQALLHEGSGSAAVNAFVEVVFDNSDNRFSMENSDEVVLRRTVGSKKDEFFLQRKRATKQEVLSLLEGAGFSKSNPYFMVQQGKIQALCLMSDAERLKLLQQVAGTTLYEDKKAESLVKMEENSQSIEKINSILEDIDKRLGELQGEKEELTAYQSLDRERKALEYTLYDKELRKARLVLDNIEHQRVNHLREQGETYELVKRTHDEIQSAEADQKIKIEKLKRVRNNRIDLEQTKTEALTLKTKLGLQCQELEDQLSQMQETAERNEKELTRLEKEIGQTQELLAEKDILLKEQEAFLREMEKEKNEASKIADVLYSRQGRGKQYSSKRERDTALRKQIRELNAQKNEKEEALKQQQDSLANVRRQADNDEKMIEQKEQDIKEKQEALQMLRKRLDEAQKKRIELMDVRKDAYKKKENLSEQLQDLRELQFQTKQRMYRSMPRATSIGLRNLQSIVDHEGLIPGEQYFGMVMENMRLKDPKFQTAVERAAQNALFHVIVDTDATAALLMRRLEQGRLGRITFLPLNQLRVDRNTRYPTSDVVTPLLQTCIDFDPKVATAMYHVFDRKLLAKTAEDATEWSEKVRMDCITLEGDLISRKGSMSGGYVDVQKSRLKIFSEKVIAEKEFRSVDEQGRLADAAADQAAHNVTKISQEIGILQQKEAQISQQIQSLEGEQSQLQTHIGLAKKQADRLESQAVSLLERDIAACQFDVARLEEEIGTELTDKLSAQDRAELIRVREVQESLAGKIVDQREKVDDIRAERNRLESHLENNLYKRRASLTQASNDDDGTGTGTSSRIIQDQKARQLEERNLELREASRDLEDLEEKLEETVSYENQLKQEVIDGKTNMEKLRNLDIRYARTLEESKRRGESLMGKKSLNIGRRDNYMRKIQELGSLPPDSELRNYRNMSIDGLEKELERVNRKLKKFSHVNKKAFDQYVNFSEKRESLMERKDELDRGAEKVKELVESLDRKKDEAINRTFRGVSKHFTDVFKELVPLGEGELIMRTAIDEQTEGGEDEMESEEEGSPKKSKGFDPDNPDVSLYRGVGVKVRFSAVGENFIMSQLSGGQKALVALALIFAIQRCDPAPFYIFDELDQALDSSYRQSVANLIQRQANNKDNPTQFIMSTFRPELVAISKNCYGISHQNKVSSIHSLPKNDALKFIRNLMSEEEAVGSTSTSVERSSVSRKRKSSAMEDEDSGEVGMTFTEDSQAASTQSLGTQPAQLEQEVS